MPYRFKFQSADHSFECMLQCRRCTASKKDGSQCTRTVCIGVPYCYTHLLYTKNLRIKQSTLPDAGKGLFAVKPRGGNDIVFRPGDRIIEYEGQVIDRPTLDQRYGEFTAPYGLMRAEGEYEDAACQRGVGSLANHQPGSRANARYSVGRNPRRMNLVATKNIRNGQEIFCDYTGGRGRGADSRYRFDEDATSSTRPARARRT